MYFESNILYAKEFKRDYIKVDENREIHYVISTNQQQSRWHVAINLVNVDTGKWIQRTDLSGILEKYPDVITYLQTVRNNILQPKDINTEMQDDFLLVCKKLTELNDLTLAFGQRYFPNV